MDVKYPYVLPQFELFVMNALKRICINSDESGKMCLNVIRDSAKCPFCKQDPYRLVGKSLNSYRVVFRKGKGKDEKVMTVADIERLFAGISLETAKEKFGCEQGLAVFISRYFVVPSQINRPERRMNSKGVDELTASLSAIVSSAMALKATASTEDPDFDKLYSHFVRCIKNY